MSVTQQDQECEEWQRPLRPSRSRSNWWYPTWRKRPSRVDIGVVVDAVNEVLRISTEAVVEPPSSVTTTADSVKLEGRLVIPLHRAMALSESEKMR